MTTGEIVEESWVLEAKDRCDRCGAQAYMLANLNGGDLLFCVHHAQKFKDSLVAAGAEILDETEHLKSISHHLS